jgi:hypothetical protein
VTLHQHHLQDITENGLTSLSHPSRQRSRDT